MPRLTIYIDGELRRQLDELAKAGLEIHLSRSASAGIRSEIDTLLADKPAAILARMIGTRTAAEDSEAEIGSEDGKRWATLRADPNELNRLQSLVDDDERWGAFFDPDHGSMYGPDVRLFAYICGSPQQPNRARSELFWDAIAGLDPARASLQVNRSARYVEAFALAALEVWSSVRPLYINHKLRS
jgi:hypothetical protein